MSNEDFGSMMKYGFEVDYKGKDSELRCFECGKYSKLKKVKVGNDKKWRMICKDKHRYKLVNFMILHVNMRDELLRAFMENNCNVKAN